MVYEIMVPIQRFDRRHFPSSEQINGEVVRYFWRQHFMKCFLYQSGYQNNVAIELFDLNYS